MSDVDHLNGSSSIQLEHAKQNNIVLDSIEGPQEPLHDHVNVGKCIEESTLPIVDGENVCSQSSPPELGVKSMVLKVPRANSKLILQNMEEVLNSVKKKHRQKHRRKKEQKKLAMMAVAEHEKREKPYEKDVEYKDTPSSTSKNSFNNNGNTRRSDKLVKKPLQEQQAVQEQSVQSNQIGKGKHSNSKKSKATISPLTTTSPAKSSVNSNGILNHLIRTPEKTENLQMSSEENTKLLEKSKPVVKPATNAFEVMMNARNKSIGSNTPGKEPNNTDGSPIANSINAKRKLMLQSWADRKGGIKRKLDEEMRDAYIEERLEERAKRLKKMLTSGGNPGATYSPKTSKNDSASKKNDQSHSSSRSKTKRRNKVSSRRLRRMSTSDSIESVADAEAIDIETDEFLDKLSSPTKKRQSLLGYFSKIPSPTEVTSKSVITTPVSSVDVKNDRNSIKNDMDTPKRRGKHTKRKLEDQNNSNELQITENIESVVEVPSNQLSNVRPKRACAEKAKYDYDLEGEECPKKDRKSIKAVSSDSNKDSIGMAKNEQRRSVRKPRRSSIDVVDNDLTNDDIVIINLDDSSSFSISNEVKTPKKLAPLFVRSLPKPSPDPETLKARQEFLRSGVPEKLKLEQGKQKQLEQIYEEMIELYPKISHLKQWNKDDENFLSKAPLYNKRFPFKKDEPFKILNDIYNENSRTTGSGKKSKSSRSRCSLIGLTDCLPKDFRSDKKSSISSNHLHQTLVATLPVVSNKRLIIKSWKTDFDRFPTYKCYNQLRTKYRFFSALDSAQDTEQITESFVVTRSTRRSLEASIASSGLQRSVEISMDDEVKPPATAPNGELLFTEKYKPMLFEQVLVNLTPVSQLRDFLASWSNGNGGSAKNSQNILDDCIDFWNDSSSSQQATCNSVVLIGPASSGKTNAVFTLANEMNFNVLEINAGMKRTGKKLIQELLEATQSHQIRNEATGGAAVKSKAQKNLLKMSLNSLKGRKQTNTNNGSTIEAEPTIVSDLNVRKCLILIEDADIVFDQTDAGFTDAVYTLAASSKRPVIVIATNPNCLHLQRLMAQNTIKFTAPNALSISKYLAVLSLMENCPVSLDDLISLYLFNQHDLRKTLHELQFFIQSGGDIKKETNQSNITSNIQYSDQTIPKQQRTPQKEIDSCEKTTPGKYFASPGKRSLGLSEDTQSLSVGVHDEQLKREALPKHQPETNQEDLYIHRTLFEFYTVDQNAKERIPFPVNFDLFHVNLTDIFAVANNLKSHNETATANSNTSSKRKTRSPKKVWLSNATATDIVNDNSKNIQTFKSLDALSSFYNNVSIAALVVARDELCVNNSKGLQYGRDRLMPYLSESVAHSLLENAINVNLKAELCPYNLFEGQKKISTTLCDNMGSMVMTQTKRGRFLDYEPVLRSICRSEQHRSAQERRSTRFYHYLRNSCIDMFNSSQRSFESVCGIFQEQQEHSETQPKVDEN